MRKVRHQQCLVNNKPVILLALAKEERTFRLYYILECPRNLGRCIQAPFCTGRPMLLYNFQHSSLPVLTPTSLRCEFCFGQLIFRGWETRRDGCLCTCDMQAMTGRLRSSDESAGEVLSFFASCTAVSETGAGELRCFPRPTEIERVAD